MRILTWYVNRATAARSGVWDLVLGQDPDIALLQAVGGLPAYISETYTVISKTPVNKAGLDQRFRSVVISKRALTVATPALQCAHPWITEQAQFFRGNIFLLRFTTDESSAINVVHVYSPHWPVARAKWAGLDVSDIKLENNRDIWATEILWRLLRDSMPLYDGEWVVAGNFNQCETMDLPRDRGNHEFTARMNDLGLHEAARNHFGRIVPTYRNNVGRGGAIEHQLDHVYISAGLFRRPYSVEVGDAATYFRPGLSNHLPITVTIDVTNQGC